MNTFSHRFNKFDMFVIVLGCIVTISLIVKNQLHPGDWYGAGATLTALATVTYAIASSSYRK